MVSRRTFLGTIATGMSLFGPTFRAYAANDLEAIRDSLRQALPEREFQREVAKPPLVQRGSPNRATQVYQKRATGVVLLAGERGIGTGALISSSGDIITNEHVAQDAHKDGGPNGSRFGSSPQERRG